MVTDVRPSPLAGKWYPGRADALSAMIDQYLDAAHPKSEPGIDAGKLLGLLAPHAGYRYSGPVAAHAFALVKGMSFDTVAVIGPMHHPYSGALLTSAHTAYETPFGQISVDQDVLAALDKTVPLTRIRQDPEHSIEIELPFLQTVLEPGFTFVPLMMRDQSIEQSRRLGTALADALYGRRVLLVASSDLSHFYPQTVANKLDQKMLGCIASMNAEQVIDYNENGTAFACGYGAIATVIYAVRNWSVNQAAIVNYATSGDVTGDMDQVVGYGAAAFWQAKAPTGLSIT